MNAIQLVVFGGLALIRTFAFLITFPLFRQWLKPPVVIVFAIAITIGCAPNSTQSLLPASFSPPVIAMLAATEALFGLLLAAPIAILFEALPMAGRLVDCFRGALFAEQILPGLEQRTAPLEAVSLLIVLFIVFPLRGYTAILAPLITTFHRPELEPGLGLLGLAQVVAPGTGAAMKLAGIAFQSLRCAVLFAGPAITVLVLMESVALVLARLLPRVNITQELGPVKLVAGMLLFALLYGDPSRVSLGVPLVPADPLLLLHP